MTPLGTVALRLLVLGTALCAVSAQMQSAYFRADYKSDVVLGLDHVLRVPIEVYDYYTTSTNASNLFVRLEPLPDSGDSSDRFGPCFIPAMIDAPIDGQALRVTDRRVTWHLATKYETSTVPSYPGVLSDGDSRPLCLSERSGVCAGLPLNPASNACNGPLHRNCPSCWTPDYFTCKYNGVALNPGYPMRPDGYDAALQWPPLANAVRPPTTVWPIYYDWPPKCGFNLTRPANAMWPQEFPWPPPLCAKDTVTNRTAISAVVAIDLLMARASCPSRMSVTHAGDSDSYGFVLTFGYRNDDAAGSRMQFSTSRAFTASVQTDFSTSLSWSQADRDSDDDDDDDHGTGTGTETGVADMLSYSGATITILRATPVLTSGARGKLQVSYRVRFVAVSPNSFVRIVSAPATTNQAVGAKRFIPSPANCYGLSLVGSMGDAAALATCANNFCEQEITVITDERALDADGLAFQRPCPTSATGGMYSFSVEFEVCRAGGVVCSTTKRNETVVSFVAISVFPATTGSVADAVMRFDSKPSAGFMAGMSKCAWPASSTWRYVAEANGRAYLAVSAYLSNASAELGTLPGGTVRYNTYFSTDRLLINGVPLADLSSTLAPPQYYQPRSSGRLVFHDQVCKSNCAVDHGLNCDAFAISMDAVTDWFTSGQIQGSNIVVSATVIMRAYLPDQTPTPAVTPVSTSVETASSARRLLSYLQKEVSHILPKDVSATVAKDSGSTLALTFGDVELTSMSPLDPRVQRMQRTHSLYTWPVVVGVCLGISALCCTVVLVSNRKCAPIIESTKSGHRHFR